MKQLQITSQFKKDLKRYKRRPDKISALENVLGMLARGETLPAKHNLHKLSGDYNGSWECHVENDLLLIWIDPEENVIKLIRFGTHSELFKAWSFPAGLQGVSLQCNRGAGWIWGIRGNVLFSRVL